METLWFLAIVISFVIIVIGATLCYLENVRFSRFYLSEVLIEFSKNLIIWSGSIGMFFIDNTIFRLFMLACLIIWFLDKLGY